MSIDEVAESPILALIDRIFAMRQAGHDVLGLHIGEPDFDTPQGIREAAYRAMNDGFTHYASAQGMPDLRAAIAERLRVRHQIPVEAKDIVVMTAKFAIYATLLATVSGGDEVLLPNPTYLFEQPILLAGARPVYVPLHGDFSLDVDAIEAAVTPRSRLLILASPGNPTGRVMRRAEIRAALDLARRHHLTLVTDETYAALVFDGVHVSPASLGVPDVPVVTIGSFSKAYAMTGWRAGFVVAPRETVARLVKVVEHTFTCLPPFIQKACLWALEHAHPDEDRMRETFRDRRAHLLGRLARVEGLTTIAPEGAFYVFPRYDLDLPSVRFCSDLLAAERLALVPGVAFGPNGEGHIRISYSSPIPALNEGVDRLERFLQRARTVRPERAEPRAPRL
jgi:aspartate aminotransferase